MDDKYLQIIDNEIIPRIKTGDIALFIGAGFSIGTKSINTTIPSTPQLIDRLLTASGVNDINARNNTDLPSAFSYGQIKIPDFESFIKNNFTTNNPQLWQINVLRMWWRIIFTTNIDNIFECARKITKSDPEKQPDFNFYNYLDAEPVTKTPISPPIVKLHGCVNSFDKGFVFDHFSYADNTVRQSDWIRVCALHISYGNCLFVGSRFKESDIDAQIRQRASWEASKGFDSWIVLSDYSIIDEELYRSRGIIPIKATAEEFFSYIFNKVGYISPGKFIKQKAPYLAESIALDSSIAWFSSNFDSVRDIVASSKKQNGVFTRFYSGDSPEWFYIANDVPAKLSNLSKLEGEINSLKSSKERIKLINIYGAVGSGKTTLAKQVLAKLSEVESNVYCHSGLHGLQIEPLWDVVKNSKGLFIIYFDAASNSYYALNEILERAEQTNTNVKLCIITESRTVLHKRNVRHFKDIHPNKIISFEIHNLSKPDIKLLLDKSMVIGHKFEKMISSTVDEAIDKIYDTERGYKGDLLATLYDLSNSKSFYQLLDDEYHEINSERALSIFEKVSIITSVSLQIPLEYLAESEKISVHTCLSLLNNELDGKIIIRTTRGGGFVVSARHSSISNHHIKNCIPKEKIKENIISISKCLSGKFTIRDIKDHPISYRIYRNILSCHYLTDEVFTRENYNYIYDIYSSCQKYYAQDGIFWLQYGRFLESDRKLDDALQCFRTGLTLYDSFQIRHALGQTLLKIFRRDSFADVNMLTEGISILESEISQRPTDRYPITTLISELLAIAKSSYTDDGSLVAKLKELTEKSFTFNESNDDELDRVLEKAAKFLLMRKK